MNAKHLASLVLLVALTGCGLPSTSLAPAAKTTVQASASKLKFASVTLDVVSPIVRPEKSTELRVRIWGNKPISDTNVYWRCFGGQLEDFAAEVTNTWTAPKQEGLFRVQADVVVYYTDGTSDRGSANANIRVMK